MNYNKRKKLNIGDVFGNLLIINFRKHKQSMYVCKCLCGNIVFRRYSQLATGQSISCGCIKKNFKKNSISVGDKFSSWTVISDTGRDGKFKCQCDCGFIRLIPSHRLLHGKSKSCGCTTAERERERRAKIREINGPLPILNKMFAQYRRQASNASRRFELDFEYFCEIVGKNCHYCGGKPNNSLHRGNKNTRKFYEQFKFNGIDRLNNNLGYIKENAVTCCKTCNYAKKTKSHEKWIEYLKRLIEHNFPLNNFLNIPQCKEIKNNNEYCHNKIWKVYQASAVKRKIIFNPSREIFIKLLYCSCFYCGTLSSNKVVSAEDCLKREPFYYNGIDRLDVSIGYEDCNIVSCCRDCNYGKHVLSLSEWVNWLNRIIKHDYPSRYLATEITKPA